MADPPPDFFLPDVLTIAGPADAVVDALAGFTGVLDFRVVVTNDLDLSFRGGPMREC